MPSKSSAKPPSQNRRATIAARKIRSDAGRPKLRQPTPKQADIIITASQHPNLSLREIGAIAGADHVHVLNTLKRYNINRIETEDYKQHRANILAGMQHRLLSSITDDTITDASLLQRLTGTAILYDKERLERGQNDSNIKPMITINIRGGGHDNGNMIDITSPPTSDRAISAQVEGDVIEVLPDG